MKTESLDDQDDPVRARFHAALYSGHGGRGANRLLASDCQPQFRTVLLCAAICVGIANPDSCQADGQPPLVSDRETVNEDATNDGTTSSEKLLVTSLLTENSLRAEDWVFYSREKEAKLDETWGILSEGDDPILICKGSPYGYLRTKQQYDNFVMELDWRFPNDVNGNSGILLYTSDEEKIWPKAIQVQLHQPVAGSIFPSADAKSDNEIRDVRDVARPVNEWNVCRISSNGGTISVDINGKKIGEVTGCRPSRGWIALQSEGSEVHFRRIRIRETPPVAAPEPPTDQTTGWVVPRADVWCHVGHVEQSASVPVATRRDQRRERRLRKTSHVVHRDPLATDRHSRVGCHCLRLDVAGTPAVVVAGGADRVWPADRWRTDF